MSKILVVVYSYTGTARRLFSIETASRDAKAGGIEAPEPLSEEKKASPFEIP
jgi:hypothetical protein